MIEFNSIYNMAIELINSVAASRGFVEPNTTVCIIFARSGRVFNGVSHQDVHAEIEAVRNMQNFGENAVDSMILVDAASRCAMLPCMNCLSFIMSQNPANSGAVVCMPDRPVPLQELLSQNPLAFNPAPQGQMNSRSKHSSVVISGKSKGDLLNSRLNSLLGAANQEESEEDKALLEELENETKNKKGLFGGLFGKKK